MPTQSAASSAVKPPRGLLEAANKLHDLALLNPGAAARRVRQAADSLSFGLAWAKAAQAAAGPDAGWLQQAVARMQRAEVLLQQLVSAAEREVRGWQRGEAEIVAILAEVQALYAAAASASTSASATLAPPQERSAIRKAAPVVEDALLMFQAVVERSGLRSGLAYLVGLTDYRYAGLWRHAGGDSAAWVCVDRNDPNDIAASERAGHCSGCVHLRTRAGIKTLDEVLGAPRARSRPRPSKLYHSVPVVTPDGELLATLCLHDTVPRNPVSGQTELLDGAASLLARCRARFPA